MPEPNLIRETLPDRSSRLDANDTFTFRCGKDLECFTKCCRDVSIVLTPYDVLRLKKALHLDSTEFLEKFTLLTCTRKQKLPIVLLKMDPESKKCSFLGKEGCQVYSDRPWACRMYPLGLAEPQHPSPTDHSFCFVLHEDLCQGHGQGNPLTAADWMASQEVEAYEAMGESFKRLMLNEFWERDEALPLAKVEMYIMACYDLDRFRRFVFESRFLEVFDVAEERVEALKTDDDELLDFAADWLRFSLFGEKTMRVCRAVWDAKKQALSMARPASAPA
jgi:uncharacterized protein